MVEKIFTSPQPCEIDNDGASVLSWEQSRGGLNDRASATEAVFATRIHL